MLSLLRFLHNPTVLFPHQSTQSAGIPTYEALLEELAEKCEGYSGAALAGVARAAASHALERAVNRYSQPLNGNSDGIAGGKSIMDCLVTHEDFDEAVADVFASMGTSDYSDDEEEDADEESESDDQDDDDESRTNLEKDISEDPVSPE